MSSDLGYKAWSWLISRIQFCTGDRHLFLALRIIFIVFLLIVITGFILTISLSSTSPEAIFSKGIFGFIAFGFIGTIIILFSLLVVKVIFHFLYLGKPTTKLFFYRCLQGFLCLTPIASGCSLGLSGESWYVYLPLFLNSGLALVWKFPTRNRWIEWIKKYPQLSE